MTPTVNAKTVIRIGDKVFNKIDGITRFFDTDLNKQYEDNQHKILRETFQRAWKHFWDIHSNHFFEKGIDIGNENNSSISYFSDCITVFSKAKQKMNTVIKKKNPYAKSSGASVKSAAIVAVPDIQFTLKFKYEDKMRTLTVSLDSYQINNDEVDLDSYVKALNDELQRIRNCFLHGSYKGAKILENFIDTLHAHNYTSIKGVDAKIMKEIYPKIKEHFLDFNKFSFERQKAILLKACLRGMQNERKDIHSFAKATFEVLVESNAINVVEAFGYTNKKICEHRKDLMDYETHEIWAKNILIFTDYNTGTFRTSYHSHDLWALLAS